MRVISLIIAVALCISTIYSKLPTFTRGVYLLLADDSETVKNTEGVEVLSTLEWTPVIGSWI